ncbi:MAG: agmatinase [Desulfurococcales archaeon]|nr:agmatinase [Desulfurococcales archaeon]
MYRSLAGLIDLYRTRGPLFAGIDTRRERTRYSVIGAPLDATASYRKGQRWAPRSIREASENIEPNGYYARGITIEEAGVYDEGDIALPHGDAVEAVRRIAGVVGEIASEGRIPVVLGGEHTVTLGALEGLAGAGVRPCILVLDAHLDLRNEYLGEEVSHATVMRRILERVHPPVLVYIGPRAYDREEEGLASGRSGVEVIYSWEVERIGPVNAGSRARNLLSGCSRVYISIDMDVYDPAYAPGVGTPEPPGLRAREVFRILREVVDYRVVGIDIVEVTPSYDCGSVTSVLAAKTLQEVILLAESSRRTRSRKPS